MPHGAAGPSSRPHASPPGTRHSILVIDDEPVMGSVLRRIFNATHEVTTVVSGREALALLLAGAEPDVVLCDVVMPGMSGIQVFEAVRALKPRLAARFVFVTGGAIHERSQEFLDAVPNPVLPKPFDLDAVRDAVRRAQLVRSA
jgi:CheY-like chemotaxis protein